MKYLILPIIMLFVCAALGVSAFFILKGDERKRKSGDLSQAEKSANEFNNVRDIRGKYLYSIDGYVMSFVRINPISIDLYSKSEKQMFIKLLTAELSSVQHPFKFLALSRPIDISPLITELSDLLVQADSTQRELLTKELEEMNKYSGSGEVVERQFYISVWTKYEEGCESDLYSKAKNLCVVFENGGLSCEIIEEDEIIKLIGLINNPSYAHIEDTDYAEPLTALY